VSITLITPSRTWSLAFFVSASTLHADASRCCCYLPRAKCRNPLTRTPTTRPWRIAESDSVVGLLVVRRARDDGRGIWWPAKRSIIVNVGLLFAVGLRRLQKAPWYLPSFAGKGWKVT